MAFDVPKTEVFACFCYELTREWLRDAQRRRPDFDLDARQIWGVDGKKLFPRDFVRPYLGLSREEQKRVQRAFPSYYAKSLTDVVRESIAAKKSDAELLRNVNYWTSLHKEGKAQGRAALVAQLRTGLRVLGAFRVLQKHRWNNNPTDLYHSQREWINARERAQSMIKRWFPILHKLIRVP